MERSNYDSVRKTLSASKFINKIVGKLHPISSTSAGAFIKVTSWIVQGAIYAEDWLNTDKQIQKRIDEVLNLVKSANYANNPELVSQFEQYVKASLKHWVPDRDYPKIGYLPKEFLYDQSLGEIDITKYWPEATQQDREKYIALTCEELILNYENIWNNLYQYPRIK